MRTFKNLSRISVLLMMTSMVSACGAQAYRQPASDGLGQNLGGGGTPSPDPTPTPTVSPTPTAAPPITYSFTITGSGSYTSPAVNTDNILKLRIKSGPAQLVSGTGFTPVWYCMTYMVSVIGKDVRTQTLAVNGGGSNCPSAPSEQIIDFSDRLSPGHNAVTITVSAVQNDFRYNNCLQSPWLYSAWPYGPYSCDLYKSLTNMYATHIASGTLDIQVNGTGL